MIKLLLASLVAVGLIGGPQVVTFGKEKTGDKQEDTAKKGPMQIHTEQDKECKKSKKKCKNSKSYGPIHPAETAPSTL